MGDQKLRLLVGTLQTAMELVGNVANDVQHLANKEPEVKPEELTLFLHYMGEVWVYTYFSVGNVPESTGKVKPEAFTEFLQRELSYYHTVKLVLHKNGDTPPGWSDAHQFYLREKGKRLLFVPEEWHDMSILIDVLIKYFNSGDGEVDFQFRGPEEKRAFQRKALKLATNLTLFLNSCQE